MLSLLLRTLRFLPTTSNIEVENASSVSQCCRRYWYLFYRSFSFLDDVPFYRPTGAAATALTATTKAGWEFLSEGGDSHATLGVESLASIGTASSLPSATAAAAMEEEDAEETKRALGQLREDKKVGTVL